MKTKARKAYPRVGNGDQVCPSSNRRRKKSCQDLQMKERKVAELITSSTRKHRIVHVSTSLVSPNHENIAAKGARAVSDTKDFAGDVCRDLRLAFSTIDGVSIERKVCMQKAHPSVLETIFSPVFHMTKDVPSGASTSCPDTVEQGEELTDKIQMADDRYDNTDECKENSTSIIVSAPNSDVLRNEMRTRLCTDTAMAVQGPVTNADSPPDDELIGSQTAFDVTENCIEWPLVHSGAATDPRHDSESVEEGLLNSDGASLFLAMQQTKSLECNDEAGQESRVPDEDDEMDDFDPYLFIKNLPDLSEVVSSFRPMLLPRQTRRCPPITLVLDLDETLVHSSLEQCDDADFTFPVHFNLKEHMVYVRCRPHLQLFMDRVADMFEIIVFTASQSIYAEQLLNVLDPKRKLIRHRVYRESCVFVEGNYLKDLTVLGRDLAQVAIIDNSPQASQLNMIYTISSTITTLRYMSHHNWRMKCKSPIQKTTFQASIRFSLQAIFLMCGPRQFAIDKQAHTRPLDSKLTMASLLRAGLTIVQTVP